MFISCIIQERRSRLSGLAVGERARCGAGTMLLLKIEQAHCGCERFGALLAISLEGR